MASTTLANSASAPSPISLTKRAAMVVDFLIDELPAVDHERGERVGSIGRQDTTISNHIGGWDRGKPSPDASSSHDGPSPAGSQSKVKRRASPSRPFVQRSLQTILRLDSNCSSWVNFGATAAKNEWGSERACYRPVVDLIEMPDRERFVTTSTSPATENYYATLLQELTHWTGHASRLNRDLKNRFGDEAYAMEELVAELGAAFLCADLGISNAPRPDHAAYVNHWLKVLQDDTRAIFTAAAKAHAAADYLTALHGPIQHGPIQ
jgi:hypothetical protein